MMDAGQRASFLEQQCNAALMHLRSAEMSYVDANKIVELVSSSHSPFTPEQRDRICSVTDELLLRNNGVSEASGSKAGQQTHQYLHMYLTESVWKVVLSHESMDHKLEQCARYFCNTLYLRNLPRRRVGTWWH